MHTKIACGFVIILVCPCVLQPEGVKEWSKTVRSRFIELTSAHAKAMIHEILEGNLIVVSAFIPLVGEAVIVWFPLIYTPLSVVLVH